MVHEWSTKPANLPKSKGFCNRLLLGRKALPAECSGSLCLLDGNLFKKTNSAREKYLLPANLLLSPHKCKCALTSQGTQAQVFCHLQSGLLVLMLIILLLLASDALQLSCSCWHCRVERCLSETCPSWSPLGAPTAMCKLLQMLSYLASCARLLEWISVFRPEFHRLRQIFDCLAEMI